MSGHDRVKNTAARTFASLTAWLIRDEWRTHAKLGSAFLIFAPVTLFALTVLGFVYRTGEGYAQALFIVLFAFGLQLGASVFTRQSRTAARSGGPSPSMLLLSSYSLPVSPRVVAAAYITKQAVYYGAGVALPIAAGLSVQHSERFSLTLLAVFITLLLGISLGVIIGTALATRERAAVSLSAVVVALTVAAAFGLPTRVLTPYYAYTANTLPATITATSIAIASVGLAILVFNPTRAHRRQMVRSKFKTLRQRSPIPISPITTRLLLLFSRSRGGFLKIPIAVAIYTAAVGVVIGQLRQETAILHIGVMTGVLCSLIAVLLFYWLLQIDRQGQYVPLPIERRTIISSLARFHLSLTLPSTLASYVILMNLAPVPFRDVILGGIVVVSFPTYVGGVLFFAAGVSPSSLAVQPRHFASTIVAVAVPIVCGVAFAYLAPPLTLPVVGLGAAFCGLSAIAGVWLVRKAASVTWPSA